MPPLRTPVLAATMFLFALPTPTARAQNLEATLKKVKVQDADCVQVVTVVPKGLAARLGLKEGDVIQKVNDKSVRSPAEVLEAVVSNRHLTIEVLYSGNPQKIQAEVYWPPRQPVKESQGQKKSSSSERDRRPVVINQKRVDR